MADGRPWPRISIITPSFNQGQFIERTIRSVLLQGYPNLEYFIMDGGSGDGTVEIIRKYEPWLTGWVSEKDRGQSHAINKGLARATGTIVNWLNSDDILLPGALAGVAALSVKRPDCVAWAGACRRVDHKGRLIVTYQPRGLTRDQLADWYHQGYVSQPACFFSRAASDRVGPVAEDLHYSLDMDYWIRLAGIGTFAATDDLWCEEVSHPECKCSAHAGMSAAEGYLVQMRHGYQELALKRMAETLDEANRLRTGTFLYRAVWQVNLLMRPLLDWIRGRRRPLPSEDRP